MGTSIAEASLLGLYLETLLYGVFLVLYLLTLFILLTKNGIQRRLLIPVATLLLCIETAHLVINFARVLEAFILNVGTISADTYYINFASPLNLAKATLYGAQTILADCVIVWRCYMLNKKSVLVAIPGCIALLVNWATGFYVIWCLSRTPVGSAILPSADGFITTFYTLTMVISISCTSLISWRIYQAPSFVPDGSPLLPVFIVIIETGALYAASVLALLIAFLTRSNGQFTVLDIIPAIVGISFCLIILQVHFQVDAKFPAEQPAEPRGILFRVRNVRDVDSMGRATVLTTVHVAEEDEAQNENEMGMIGRRKSILYSSNVGHRYT